ncbi:Hypothetical protein D9617_52g060380 [Elsinoe fawcettii]|nr:Hypothetical protein D9617_52g060380 [Elsinoe fawcettii]
MNGGRTASCCLGYISEASQKHYVHKVKPQLPIGQTPTLALHDILSAGRNTGTVAVPTISFADRFELSFLMAVSLLQLHSTPWLDLKWSIRDVHVSTKPNGPLRKSTYITARFPPLAKAPTSYQGAPVRKYAVKHEAIFALGVALLQLATESTLEREETAQDRRTPDIADYETAMRLLNEREQKRADLPEWISVVRMCLDCKFHNEPNFDDEEFRSEYYNYVIAPLRRLYGYLRP